RVSIVDRNGSAKSVKGYIVATQFASEANPRFRSALYAEDPATPGDEPLSSDFSNGIGGAVCTIHYARIVEKLNQPVLAAALATQYPVTADYLIRVSRWSMLAGPAQGTKFVGGIYPGAGVVEPILNKENNQIYFRTSDPFRLDMGRGT